MVYKSCPCAAKLSGLFAPGISMNSGTVYETVNVFSDLFFS